MTPQLTFRAALAATLVATAQLAAAADQPPPAAAPPAGTGLEELVGGERPAFPGFDDLRCFANPWCWIYAHDEQEAAVVDGMVRAAASTFEKRFGVPPRRGILFSTDGDLQLPDDFRVHLRRGGGFWYGPFVSPAFIAKQFDDGSLRESLVPQLRRAIREQAKQPDLTDEQIDARFGPQIERIIASSRERLLRQSSGISAHECGHFWFISTYWPEHSLKESKRDAVTYGGPAADWLDEAAAILLEDGQLTAKRRATFRRTFADQRDKVIPLARLFAMDHPHERRPAAGRDRPAGRTGVRVTLEATAVNPGAGSTGAFYDQIRALVDFMLERSGNPMLFASVAEAARAGDDMAVWLARNGVANTLPATVPDLEKEFLTWVEEDVAKHDSPERPREPKARKEGG